MTFQAGFQRCDGQIPVCTNRLPARRQRCTVSNRLLRVVKHRNGMGESIKAPAELSPGSLFKLLNEHRDTDTQNSEDGDNTFYR